jgi:hypothetical protein
MRNHVKKIRRNLKVLTGRAMAEMEAQGTGGYLVQVMHDEGCPGLLHQSMLRCTCEPEIQFAKFRNNDG